MPLIPAGPRHLCTVLWRVATYGSGANCLFQYATGQARPIGAYGATGTLLCRGCHETYVIWHLLPDALVANRNIIRTVFYLADNVSALSFFSGW